MTDPVVSARAVEQYRDEQIAKLSKRLDSLEAAVPEQLKKLTDTVSQVSAALDNIGNGQQKLRDDFVKALEVTQKTISEATVQYVNDRLSGQPAQQGQLQTSTGPRGVLDGIFDKIGPAINKAVDRWADTANLPFTGSQAAPAATSEIVDLERQVRNVFELQYRNNMRKFVASAYRDLGLPAPEVVKVGVNH